MNDPQKLTRRTVLAGASALALGVGRQTVSSAAAAADRWQIGCYTRPWAQYEWPVALDAIAEAGYRYIGLMTVKSPKRYIISPDTTLDEAAAVGTQVKNRGLKIVSIWGGGLPVNKSLQAGIDTLRHLIDLCVAVGSQALLLGGTNEKLHDLYWKAVAECCDYAGEKQIGLTIKPHGGANATGAQLRKTVEGVGKKQLSVWYDAGNIFFYSDGKLNPVDDAPSVAGLVTGWCIKDFRPPKSVDVSPGAGQVDFPAVFAQLKKGGFTSGALVVETLGPGELPQLLASARDARQFLERLVA